MASVEEYAVVGTPWKRDCSILVERVEKWRDERSWYLLAKAWETLS